jgi:hypothetical protein
MKLIYNRDYRLETNFGTGGKVTTDFFGGDDQASAVVCQPDGKIVAAGFAFNTHDLNFNFALARYFPKSTKHYRISTEHE